MACNFIALNIFLIRPMIPPNENQSKKSSDDLLNHVLNWRYLFFKYILGLFFFINYSLKIYISNGWKNSINYIQNLMSYV